MANKRRNSKGKAFPTASELARDGDITVEERKIQQRIESLDLVVAGKKRRRVPTSREKLEFKKSLLLGIEVLLMTLFILAIVGMLNQKYHFLW
ncbi:MAG: hypothetical protein JNJ83_08960 [Verrucomicrobiaceae bacterium]|nr:hypothetical protein [Verrucomicrobiaceae bacterium]